MPLYNFIQAIVTGDVVKWVGSIEAWNDIFIEYSDLMPSKNSTYVVQLRSEISHIKTKIAVIQSIIDVLSKQYISELIPILNEYGFYYEFTTNTMFNDIQSIIAESKQFVVRKRVLEGELERFIEGQKDGKMTQNEWDELITELERFQGYAFDTKILTVSKFVAIFNRYKRENGTNRKD